MISGASLLETLTLEDDIDFGRFGDDDDKVQRFQIRNHPCLKLVDASDLSNCKGFEITGAPSLVKVLLPYIGYLDDFQISMTPNLKLVYIKGGPSSVSGGPWNDEFINKLITELPSLELLTLGHQHLRREIKITNTGNHRKIMIREIPPRTQNY